MTPTTSTAKNGKKAKTSLQVVRCECGAKILLVPDVKAMSVAIEAHLKTHKAKDDELTEEMLDALRTGIITQIFEKIAAAQP